MQCGWQWVRQHDYRVLYTVYIALSGNECMRMLFGEGLENKSYETISIRIQSANLLQYYLIGFKLKGKVI